MFMMRLTSEAIRQGLYPPSMRGHMLSRERWDVLCEDNQIRVAEGKDIEPVEVENAKFWAYLINT